MIDSEVVRPHHDLGAQLIGRKDRLSWLIQFINDNAVLGKVRLNLFVVGSTVLIFVGSDVAEQSTEAGY